MAKNIHSDTEALKGCIDSMNELLAEVSGAKIAVYDAGSDTGLTHNRLVSTEQAVTQCEAALINLITMTVDVLQNSYDQILAADQAAAGSY